MTKPKHRVASVLLTLCLTMVLCAGFMLAAPVQVQAAAPFQLHVDINGTVFAAGESDILVELLSEEDPNIPAELMTFNVYLDWNPALYDPTVDYTVTYSYDDQIYHNSVNMQLSTTNTKPPNPNDPTDPTGMREIVKTESWTYPPATTSYNCFTISYQGYTETLEFTVAWNTTEWYAARNAPKQGHTEPTPAPDAGTDEYWLRHYDFWLPVHAQLTALGNTGNVTVDTAGHSIDHIQHFVFDALNNTSRTLTVKHQGATYVIRGQKESDDHLWMGKIALANNHAFSILVWARQ